MEIFLIALLSLSLAGVLSSYLLQQRSLKHYKSRLSGYEDRGREKAEKLVDEAKTRALQILKQARVEWEKDRSRLDEKLERVAERDSNDYAGVISQMTKTLEQEVLREISEFKKSINQETVGLEKTIAENAKQEMDSIKLEINNYRSAKLEEIDTQIKRLVKDATLRVFGKGLGLEQQEELVMTAIEEAKNDNII